MHHGLTGPTSSVRYARMSNTALLRSSIFVALATLAACSSGVTSSPDASNDAAVETSTETSTSTPSCADYCSTIQAACTTSRQQYSDLDACMKSCLAFPVGLASDTTGDTLGCRVDHARLAASAATECAPAGPGGGGVCGENCDGFCDIVMTYCTDANAAKIYDSRDACMADCAAHGTDVTFTAGDPGRTDMGNEVACVLYHAQMGAVAPVSHCLGDLALTADTCR
jgi:hypothetical protein